MKEERRGKLLLLFVAVLIAIAAAPSVYSANLSTFNGNFSDGFELGYFNLSNGWDNNTASPWTVSTALPYSGIYAAGSSGTSGALSILYLNMSSVGYQNISLKFFYDNSGSIGGGYNVSWWNGSAWKLIVNETAAIIGYKNSSYNFTSDANNNPGLSIRFSCLGTVPGRICYLDNFSLSGILSENLTNITFISQVPPDISSTNVIGTPVNITYYINDSDGINYSTIWLYYKVNTTTSDCWVSINGTVELCGYHKKSSFSNVSNINWLWQIYANDIYRATYNYDEHVMENTNHIAYNMTDAANDFVKVRLFNVSSSKTYSFFEFMVAPRSSAAKLINIWYCNSSYTTGDVAGGAGGEFCTKIYSLDAAVPYNHSYNLSSHYVVPFAINSTTGKVGLVYVTPVSYFVFDVTDTVGWAAYYIQNISRNDTSQYSINKGGAWINLNGTIDAHLNQYEGNESFWYYACANDTLGNGTCSAVRQDFINLSGLPPTPPYIYNPAGERYYRRNITINYTAAVSPNGYPIVIYNISLLNSDFSFNKTIQSNNSVNLSYVWNSTGTADGNYSIRVQACDNQSQCSYGYSELFALDNTNPVWSSPAKNETPVYWNQSIMFNASWYDLDLAGYVFYINQSGTWENSGYIPFGGTINTSENISLITANAGTNVSWYFWANDTAGNYNQTDVQNFTVQARPTSLAFSVNQSMYPQGMSPDEGYDIYIPFNARYADNLTDSLIADANCYVTNDETLDTVPLAYNSTTGNYTGQITTHMMYGVVTFNATCVKANYAPAINSTTANVWFSAYLWEWTNTSYGNNASTTHWLRSAPADGSLYTLTADIAAAAGSNFIETFPFCASGTNCAFLKDYNHIGIRYLRINLSLNDTSSCMPYLCYSVRYYDLSPIYEECGVPQAVAANNTPQVMEYNFTENHTIQQNQYLAMNAYLNCSVPSNVQVSMFYNYTGEPANLVVPDAEPTEIVSTFIGFVQKESNYTLQAGKSISGGARAFLLLNNTDVNSRYTQKFVILPILAQYINSVLNESVIVYNSTNDTWASSNASLGAPYNATVSIYNVINWQTEVIPGNTSVVEILDGVIIDAIRANESIINNSPELKVWNVNAFSIFLPMITVYNVTVLTNYSAYGVPDSFAFQINVTNSSGTFDVTNDSVVNTTTGIITFPRTDLGTAVYTVTASDMTPPTVTLISPTPNSGSMQGWNYTLINASVTNNIAVDVCLLEWNGTNESMDVVGSGASVTCWVNKTDIPDGFYSYKVWANDSIGLWNYSETRNITIDLMPPKVVNLVPVAGSSYINGTQVVITANVTEPSYGRVDTVLANVTWDTGSVEVLMSNASEIYNFTFTNTGYIGRYNVTIIANDSVGNVNSTETTYFLAIASDNIAPAVTSLYPDDGAVTALRNITFNCSATDNLGLSNISLLFSNAINSTVSAGGFSYLALFNLQLENNTVYSWSCNATDGVGNENSSAIRTLTINDSAVPDCNYSYFTGNTTNWSAVPDLTNVCNGDAVLDSFAGMIVWNGCVNAVNADFDSLVIFSYNNVTVNFGLNETFNSSAAITMRNLPWTSEPYIYVDGILCAVDVCTDITYNESTGTLVFNTSHFSSFTTGAKSNLLIWDETDNSSFPYANKTRFPYQNVKFFANYTDKNTGINISGATCVINFTDLNASMSFNSTTLIYEFNRSFSTTGNFGWNVTCNKTPTATFTTLTTNDTVNISVDALAPSITNVTNTTTNDTATINWTTDENANSTVTYGLTLGLGSDASNSSLVTAHSILITGLTNDTLYYYNITACDIFGNCNTSGTYNFTTQPGPDTEGPVFTDIANITILDNETLSYDINATDTSGVDCFGVNDTDFAINCSGFMTNATGLSIGMHWLNITVNDTLSNENYGVIYVNVTNSTIPDTNGPVFTNLANQTVQDNETFSYDINAADVSGVDCFSVNDTDFSINCSGYLTNATGLSLGLHWLNISVNDTLGNLNYGIIYVNVTNSTTPDTTSPVIISHLINPRDPSVGNFTFINASATDLNLAGIFANLTLPNGTKETIALPNNYYPLIPGRYNVTIFANDTAGNTIAVTSYFIAGNVQVLVKFNVVNRLFNGLATNLAIYFSGTNDELENHTFTGTKNDIRTDILYSLFYWLYGGEITIRLNGVNLSAMPNGTLGVDQSHASGYLVTYGIITNYTFSNAIVVINYTDTGFTDENKLKVYRCANWNFTGRACLGSWVVVAATQNKLGNTFTITTTGFSAYSIKQEAAVPASSGGGKKDGTPTGNATYTEKNKTPEAVIVPEEVVVEKNKTPEVQKPANVSAVEIAAPADIAWLFWILLVAAILIILILNRKRIEKSYVAFSKQSKRREREASNILKPLWKVAEPVHIQETISPYALFSHEPERPRRRKSHFWSSLRGFFASFFDYLDRRTARRGYAKHKEIFTVKSLLARNKNYTLSITKKIGKNLEYLTYVYRSLVPRNYGKHKDNFTIKTLLIRKRMLTPKEMAKRDKTLADLRFILVYFVVIAVFFLMVLGIGKLGIISIAGNAVSFFGNGLQAVAPPLAKILIAVLVVCGLFYSAKYLAGNLSVKRRERPVYREQKFPQTAAAAIPERKREIMIPAEIARKLVEAEKPKVNEKAAVEKPQVKENVLAEKPKISGKKSETKRERMLNELKEVYK